MGLDIDLEEILQGRCWIIDCLPSQVPAASEGQFFAVERLLVGGARGEELRRAFASVLLKLYCYHDVLVFRDQQEKGKLNPKPEKLERWVVCNREHLSIALPSERALVVVPTNSTCMELYNASPRLLDEVRALATASGLFVWKAGDGESEPASPSLPR